MTSTITVNVVCTQNCCLISSLDLNSNETKQLNLIVFNPFKFVWDCIRRVNVNTNRLSVVLCVFRGGLG